MKYSISKTVGGASVASTDSLYEAVKVAVACWAGAPGEYHIGDVEIAEPNLGLIREDGVLILYPEAVKRLYR